MMDTITFTRYAPPNGRRSEEQYKPESQEVLEKAKKIIDAGYHFEIEVLVTGAVSATIGDEDGDYAYSITPNGPDVPLGIDKMILEFDLEAVRANSGN